MRLVQNPVSTGFFVTLLFELAHAHKPEELHCLVFLVIIFTVSFMVEICSQLANVVMCSGGPVRSSWLTEKSVNVAS